MVLDFDGADIYRGYWPQVAKVSLVLCEEAKAMLLVTTSAFTELRQWLSMPCPTV
jgi:hypothetical protein